MSRAISLSILSLTLLSVFVVASAELHCHLCGNIIREQEKYFQVKGGKELFCERCFLSAPRCRLCNLPTSSANLEPDTGACPRCLARLPRCKACGKPIVGTAYTFPFAKGIYCDNCKNTRPACHVCGVPAGDDYWKYPDGRIICGECGERAVLDIGEIRQVMRDAQKIAEERLGLRIREPYQLTVERLNGFGAPSPGRRATVSDGQSPLYGKELGMFRRAGGMSEIILLFGLPSELLCETAAHEYAHAWQAENCPPDLVPELREGFAQWVAAEVLRAKRYNGALEKLEARTDFPYGTGYRRLKSMYRQTMMDLLRRGG